MGKDQHAEIRGEETDDADTHGRAEVAANDVHVDLGPGEKRQQDRPKAREIIHPRSEREVDDVAGDRANNDFEQSNRDSDPALHDRGGQRKPDPQSRRKPDVAHPKTSPTRPARPSVRTTSIPRPRRTADTELT